MSDYRLIGLQSIALGPAMVATAGMPTASQMTSIPNIVPDSCSLIIEQPGKTELMVEDSDYADIVINTPAGKFIEFATRDMSPGVIQLSLGGTTTATLWRASTDAVVVTEKSVQAISKAYGGQKFRIDIVRSAVRGNADLKFTKTESGMIGYTCDVLRPIQGATDFAIVVARIAG